MLIHRLYKSTPLLLVVLFLSGCTEAQRNAPIDPNGGIWDKYFLNPLSMTLDWLSHFGGYGIAILILTLIIRSLILPLTLKQYRSSKQMKEIQPELKKLKEKYKDDPKKQQEETMKLFQANGVNPLAGCLPLVIQAPVFIALYHAIMRNEHIRHSTFLWMQLGEADHLYLLPLIAAITTFIQQKVMASQMSAQMRKFIFIFPVLIFVMSMNFPSALPLYWVCSNSFTIVQTYFIYGRGGNAAGAVAVADGKGAAIAVRKGSAVKKGTGKAGNVQGNKGVQSKKYGNQSQKKSSQPRRKR